MRLLRRSGGGEQVEVGEGGSQGRRVDEVEGLEAGGACPCDVGLAVVDEEGLRRLQAEARRDYLEDLRCRLEHPLRSEEHTSELQSPMRISYAGFCVKKKRITQRQLQTTRMQ